MNTGDDSGVQLSCFLRGRDNTLFKISHLHFVDDSLIFYKDSEEKMFYLSWIILCFEAYSDLKVDLNKNVIFSDCGIEECQPACKRIGHKVGSLPKTYLALPFGAKFNVVSVWEGIEDKLRKRLTCWKC